MSTNDLELARARRGDRAAMEALLRRHYDTVRAVCHRIIINEADADDAVQMAMIQIVRALPSFDGRSSLSTWIYRIATNAALDELRRIRRRPVPLSGGLPEPTVDDATSGVDDQMAVVAALAGVPVEFRVVLVLRHVADLDYSEIARVLDVPVGTVRSRLSRARAHMAAALGNHPHPEQRQTPQSSTDESDGAP